MAFYIVMLRSMTGFGQAELDTDRFSVKVEIKSLNSKFMELSVRMPRSWQHKELELRREVSKWVERGTVQLNVQLQYKQVSDSVAPINRDLAAFYLKEIGELANEAGWKPEMLLNNIFAIPNLLIASDDSNNEEEWNQILLCVRKAYEQFDGFRQKEGESLSKVLSEMTSSILSKMQQIEVYEKERVDAVKERLMRDLQVLKQEVDQNRFEQELIYYIEKLDINEEKVRLNQHCSFFFETLEQASTGKKLGFIAQEMGREINTIGSKSNHPLMQRKVVEMKDELEKIKEQINNVL